MKIKFKRLISFAVCLVLFTGIFAGSSFAIKEEFAETSSFLVKVCVFIEFYYPDGSYGGYATSRGTGLLVGSDGEMKGVVTNASVVGGEHLTSFADELVETHGFGGYNIGVPQIIPDGNNNTWGISGNVIVADEDCDFAVLQLASPIYIVDELEVRRAGSLCEGEQVFSVCYAEVSDDNYELSMGEGYVSGIAVVNEDRYNYTFVSHDAPISVTAQGGFLLDCDGAVIGLLTDKAAASPFGGFCAYSVADIMTYYLYNLGWDDCEITEMPDNAVINSQTDEPQYVPGEKIPSRGFFGNIVSALTGLFRMDGGEALPGIFLSVLPVLLLLVALLTIILIAAGFLFILVLVAFIAVICVVVRKNRKARSDVPDENIIQ